MMRQQVLLNVFKRFFIISLIVIPSAALAVNDLSSFVQYSGEAESDGAGSALSNAGDVNGDGYEDFLIGASSNNSAGTNSGAAYLLYGNAAVLAGGNLSDAEIVKFSAENANDMAGGAVAAAGDVNGDGYDDILIAASSKDDTAGSVYLIYGKTDEYTSLSLAAPAVVEISGGAAGDIAGGAIAEAGDVNNDGYDDFLISAYGNSTEASFAGAVYLVYGQASDFTDFSLNATGVVKFTGAAANDSLASGLSHGDLNGDGYSDLLLSSSTLYDSTGGFYVIYGQETKLTSKSISDSSIIEVTGENEADNAGGSIASEADVNGDGYDDILVGAIQNTAGGAVAGAAYIVYGQADTLTSGSLGDTAVIKFTGENAGDLAGIDLDMLGDVNNDGYDDFIIGASMDDTIASNAGAVYLINGQADKLTSLDLSDNSITKFVGEAASDIAGDVVSRAGDINGDGFSEMLVSAYAHDGTAEDEGVTYLGYLYIDADGDGVAGTDGLFSGTDCNDDDDTVSEDQTYYIDADGDGMGNSETSTTICSGVAPEGYVDNADDTDDTIANDGVEISGDGVDNDDDGEIDEDNTLEENGEHPGYGDNDPADTTLHDAAITSVVGASAGQIKVTYKDNAVYKYRIFNHNSSVNKKTVVKHYRNTGYYIVLQAKGKRVALVNVYNGAVFNRKTLGKKASYINNGLKVMKLRNKFWAVATSKKANGQARLAVMRINVESEKLGKKTAAMFTSKQLKVNKTKKKNNILQVKSQQRVLASYRFTKKMKLKLLP